MKSIYCPIDGAVPGPDPAPDSVSVSVPDFSNKFAECLSASEAETNL